MTAFCILDPLAHHPSLVSAISAIIMYVEVVQHCQQDVQWDLKFPKRKGGIVLSQTIWGGIVQEGRTHWEYPSASRPYTVPIVHLNPQYLGTHWECIPQSVLSLHSRLFLLSIPSHCTMGRPEHTGNVPVCLPLLLCSYCPSHPTVPQGNGHTGNVPVYPTLTALFLLSIPSHCTMHREKGLRSRDRTDTVRSRELPVFARSEPLLSP